MILVFATVLPWYGLAELRTPGFLEYFLVGEHWHRFTVPGWDGDRYGHAHVFARGTIWLFAALAALPWSLLIPAAAPAQNSFAVESLMRGLSTCRNFAQALDSEKRMGLPITLPRLIGRGKWRWFEK